MITVISATNRPNSNTRRVATLAHQYFHDLGATDTQFLSLEDIPTDFYHAAMYDAAHQSPALGTLQDKFLVPANKFYFVIPEYNGGYPGVLKMFWDACSIRQYQATFHGGKKAGLLGVADGRAGNLRGLEHFAGVLNYLKITVMPNLQPLSQISKTYDSNGVFDAATSDVVKAHVKQFLDF